MALTLHICKSVCVSKFSLFEAKWHGDGETKCFHTSSGHLSLCPMLPIVSQWLCLLKAHPEPVILPQNRWSSLHCRRELCASCCGAVHLWKEYNWPENGQCGVSYLYQFSLSNRLNLACDYKGGLVSAEFLFLEALINISNIGLEGKRSFCL